MKYIKENEVYLDILVMEIERNFQSLKSQNTFCKIGLDLSELKTLLDSILIIENDFEAVDCINHFLNSLHIETYKQPPTAYTTIRVICLLYMYLIKFRSEKITNQFIMSLYKVITSSTSMNITAELEVEAKNIKSKHMTKLSLKRHEKEKLKKEEAKKIIREVWNDKSLNFNTYTKYADYIYNNKLTEVTSHRTLCTLVSEIAKENRKKK